MMQAALPRVSTCWPVVVVPLCCCGSVGHKTTFIVKCSSDPPMTTPSSLTSTHSHAQRPSRRAHRQLRRWVASAAGGRAGRPAAALHIHPVFRGHRPQPSPPHAVRGPSVAATWNPPLLYLFLHLLCFIPFVLYTGIKDLIRKA